MKKLELFALIVIISVALLLVSCGQQPTEREKKSTPTPSPEVASSAQEVQEVAVQAQIPDINKPLTGAKAMVLTKTEPELILAELADFFDQFDFDSNEEIDIEETISFYYWVENNIKYRYDDENEANPQPGSLVGDGRPGADYRQRPYETYIEGAGDCEDMATLEVAFLNYWGIAAYIAGVDAEVPGVIDHAVAIALIADNPDDFAELLGELVFWEFREGEEILAYEIEEFPAGFYMLIDNAYSDAFGYLSGGLREGQFTIYAIMPLEVPYDDVWSEFVAMVTYEWTN